jgi:hypothetical protein
MRLDTCSLIGDCSSGGLNHRDGNLAAANCTGYAVRGLLPQKANTTELTYDGLLHFNFNHIRVRRNY